MPGSVDIVDLRTATPLLPHAVSLVWHQWRHLTDDTLAVANEAWRDHLRSPALPTHLAARIDGRCIGTATLAPFDLPIRPRMTPWLAAVIVDPDHRRRGIGSALVAAVEQLAAARHGYRAIHLFTTDTVAYYARRGWTALETDTYRDEAITIMAKSLIGQ